MTPSVSQRFLISWSWGVNKKSLWNSLTGHSWCLKTVILNHFITFFKMGFSGGAVAKNSPANAGDARDMGSIPGWGRSPGEGNGNPLQYSYLGNPIDRGAWRATVHRVTKSQTWLNNWIRTNRHQYWLTELLQSKGCVSTKSSQHVVGAPGLSWIPFPPSFPFVSNLCCGFHGDECLAFSRSISHRFSSLNTTVSSSIDFSLYTNAALRLAASTEHMTFVSSIHAGMDQLQTLNWLMKSMSELFPVLSFCKWLKCWACLSTLSGTAMGYLPKGGIPGS